MVTTITAARHSIIAIRTRAIAARHLGAPWATVLRAALGDARAFAATPHRLAAPATPAPEAHHGARGVRL